jgi:hypothetical protein
MGLSTGGPPDSRWTLGHGLEQIGLAVELELEASRTIATLARVALKRVENRDEPTVTSGHADVDDVVTVMSEKVAVKRFECGFDFARPDQAAGLDCQDAHDSHDFRSLWRRVVCPTRHGRRLLLGAISAMA